MLGIYMVSQQVDGALQWRESLVGDGYKFMQVANMRMTCQWVEEGTLEWSSGQASCGWEGNL